MDAEQTRKCRDAIVMANARRLIKANKRTSNGRLYMELFGYGLSTARHCCVSELGIDPESNETSYNKMMAFIMAESNTKQFSVRKLDVKKLNHNHVLKVKIHITKQFKVRFVIATTLIKIAAFILGCDIEIENAE